MPKNTLYDKAIAQFDFNGQDHTIAELGEIWKIYFSERRRLTLQYENVFQASDDDAGEMHDLRAQLDVLELRMGQIVYSLIDVSSASLSDVALKLQIWKDIAWPASREVTRENAHDHIAISALKELTSFVKEREKVMARSS